MASSPAATKSGTRGSSAVLNFASFFLCLAYTDVAFDQSAQVQMKELLSQVIDSIADTRLIALSERTCI